MLEELDISLTYLSEDSFEAIGRSCPLLKTLKINQVIHSRGCLVPYADDETFAIAKTMPVQIMGNYICNDALLTILDGCPLLEYLDLRGCLLLDLSGNLVKMCRERIKVVLLPLGIDRLYSI